MTEATDGGEATDGANGDLTGTTFAGLEIGAVVGRDLVSTSYRATEREPDGDGSNARTVSLRVVARELCEGEGDERQLYQRFRRHAAQALTFEHPNAPATHEVGEYAGLGYLISDDVVSMSFGEYLDQEAPLDIAVALPLFEQIADVLDAGHRAGLTHGAVSPSTLRIVTENAGDDRATVQLTGHGIGALFELRIRRDRKRLDVVDELLYVAPEQLRRQPPTGRTDQYAMACALLHALTGAPPFVRDSVGGLFGAHLFVAPRLYDQVASQAVGKALSKEPRERYGTCGQMIADIERARRSAANRRVAASRRRRVAHRPGPASRPAATASPTDIGIADGERDRASTTTEHDGAAPPTMAQPPTADAGSADGNGDQQTTESIADRPAIGDKSWTARQHTPTMSYSSQAQGLADETVVEDEDDLKTMPLLSDVLRESPAPQRTAWRPPGLWLAVMVLFVVAAAAVVWLIGT